MRRNLSDAVKGRVKPMKAFLSLYRSRFHRVTSTVSSDVFQGRNPQILRELYGEEAAAVMTSDIRRLIEAPIAIREEFNLGSTPEAVIHQTQEILSGGEANEDPEMIEELVAHFNERYLL